MIAWVSALAYTGFHPLSLIPIFTEAIVHLRQIFLNIYFQGSAAGRKNKQQNASGFKAGGVYVFLK